MHLNLVIAFALHYEVFNCGEYVNSEKIRGTSFISNIRSKKLPENVFQNLLTFWRKNKMKQHSPMCAMMKLKNCLRYIFWCTKQSKHVYFALIVSKCHIRRRWFQNVYLSWSGGRFFFQNCVAHSNLYFHSLATLFTLMPHRWIFCRILIFASSGWDLSFSRFFEWVDIALKGGHHSYAKKTHQSHLCVQLFTHL